MDTLKSFIRYYKPYRAVFFVDLICAMVISLIDLAYPQILRTLTGTLFTQPGAVILKALLPIGIGLFLMYVVQSACKILRQLSGSYDGREYGARHAPAAV